MKLKHTSKTMEYVSRYPAMVRAMCGLLSCFIAMFTIIHLTGKTEAAGGNSFDIAVDPTRTYGDLTAVGEYSLPEGADYTIAQWSKLGNTSYFLTTDGRVYALGATANGAAGIGEAPPRDILRAPERVWAGEAALDGSGNWEEIGGAKYLTNIVSIAAPYAWDAAGRLYVWGINTEGCLGLNSSDTSLVAYAPVRVRAHATMGHPDDYETLPANGTFAAGTYVTNVEAMNGGQRAGYVTKGDHRFYTWGESSTWYAYAAFQGTHGYAPRPVPAGEAGDAAHGHPDDYYTVGTTKYMKNVDSYFVGSEESLVTCGGRLYACGRNRGVGGPTWPTTLSYTTGLKRLPTGANVLAADSETVGGRAVFKGVTKVMK